MIIDIDSISKQYGIEKEKKYVLEQAIGQITENEIDIRKYLKEKRICTIRSYKQKNPEETIKYWLESLKALNDYEKATKINSIPYLMKYEGMCGGNIAYADRERGEADLGKIKKIRHIYEQLASANFKLKDELKTLKLIEEIHEIYKKTPQTITQYIIENQILEYKHEINMAAYRISHWTNNTPIDTLTNEIKQSHLCNEWPEEDTNETYSETTTFEIYSEYLKELECLFLK